MGIISKITWISLAVSIIGISYVINNLIKPETAPIIEENYWGPGNPPSKPNTDIVPMKISFSQEMINDLKSRLKKTRLTPPLEGIAQEYGTNTNLLKEILTFWETKYPFKERENYLNKYPHFKTNIQGLDIHFMHIKPKDTKGIKVLPLLILHGWPGSFREFYEIIPFLTKRNPNHDFVFEVIAPSLPGFGFSQAAAKPGLGGLEMGAIFKNLMARLGHEKFYLQGGDWGGLIASMMSAVYKDRVLGLHCNMCAVNTPLAWMKRIFASIYPKMLFEEKYQNRMYPLLPYLKRMMLETGYYHIQATKPDTIGVGLNDSPAGLAAYILEKFVTGTNPEMKARVDGGLKEVFKYEDLLDNVMIYWVTNSMTTAMRIYAESRSSLHRVPIEVPSACANFRYELLYSPENILRDRFPNLIQNSHFDVGGHFIAFQMPDVLSKDIFSAVDKMIKSQ